MKGINHIRMAFLLLLLYLPWFPWYLPLVSLWEMLFAILITTVPDSDLKFEDIEIRGTKIYKKHIYHRNFIYHSIILPALTLLSSITQFKLFLCLSFGLHCICDVSFKKKGGFFTIKIRKKGFNFEMSNLWLVANFLISIILFTVLI